MADKIKLALTYFQEGNAKQALASLNEVLSQSDTATNSENIAYAWFLSAIIHMQLNDIESSIKAFKQAIEHQPVYPEAYNNLGVVLEAKNEINSAYLCYQSAVKQNPKYANAYYNLANIEKNKNEFEKAIENYSLAIKFKPDYANAQNNLALIYQHQGNYTKSQKLFELAVKNTGNDPEILNNLGFNYYCQHQYKKSQETYNNILATIPNFSPTILNFGLLLQAQGEFKKASELFLRTSQDPKFYTQAMNNLAYLSLLLGDLSTGWQYYRYRPSTRNLPFVTPDDLSDDISEKSILLYKDQGLGDEIFLSRYIPELTQHTKNITYYTDKKISTMLQRALTSITITTSEPNIEKFDIVISLGDLPRLLFQKGYTEIPNALKLIPESSIVEKIKNILPNNGKKNIAVTWEAGTTGQNTLFKHLPPKQIGEKLSSSDDNILIIQRNLKPKDLKAFEKSLKRKPFNLSFINDDLEEMLALLSLVDDYLCVSNTNNHLRDSLNLPSQVYVPHPPEWRWLNKGEKSPWFKHATIHRQNALGQWENMNKALSTHTSPSTHPNKHLNKQMNSPINKKAVLH